MKWTERRDLKDFSGRIIKDEPNYWITVFSHRHEMRREWNALDVWSDAFNAKRFIMRILSPYRTQHLPIARKLCNHRSLLLLFPRLQIGLKGEKRRAECPSSSCCVYQKCKKLATGEWMEVSSLKSKLRVAVVREIYGLKFIYNFS